MTQQTNTAAPDTAVPQTAMAVAPPQQPARPQQPAAVPFDGDALNPFASGGNYAVALRIAERLSFSTMVPKEYQGENGAQNIIIAMEMASRHRSSLFAVMQSLDIIHGRPSWRASYLIATVNSCGRFKPLRWRKVGQPGTDSWGMVAYTTDKESGEILEGPEVTIAIAKAEQWFQKNGSKWKTLPELMLMYRSAAFWTRLYAPELSLGMMTAEEERDVQDTNGLAQMSAVAQSDAIRSLEQKLRGAAAGQPVVDAEVETAQPAAQQPQAAEQAQPGLVGDKPLVDKPAEPATVKADEAPAIAQQPAAEVKPEPTKKATSAKKPAAARDGTDGSVPADQEPPPGAGDAWEPPVR